MIHKIFHVLLPLYHTMAFVLLFIFILEKSCLVWYVFKFSLILQKTQFEFPLHTHTLLCSAFVALNSGSLLENLIFKWCTRSTILQKQLIFESCRGQWNVILVLPSIRVKMKTAHFFSEFWHSLEVETKEQLNYPRI